MSLYPVSKVFEPINVARKPEMVAMVHVHSTTAILNHAYTPLLNIEAPKRDDIQKINTIIGKLMLVAKDVEAKYPILSQVAPVATNLRSAALLLAHDEALINEFAAIPFVAALINRAVNEVEIYTKHGIQCIEIENVGAPYFVGSGTCPWEELLALHVVGRAVRAKFPTVPLGIHVLSANELEVLPIAICHGAFFVRSEACLFSGIRPEGETLNNSNMPRYLYVRNVLRNLAPAVETASGVATEQFPRVWSDLQKKHTVFFQELGDLTTWTDNLLFMKLEGVIITGSETGSNVDEKSLKIARDAVDKAKAFNAKQFGHNASKAAPLPAMPVITGSGLDFDMYGKYADFMIVGTALKKGKYWENEVDEENVKAMVAKVNQLSKASA